MEHHHNKKSWVEDREALALVLGFLSTFLTFINVVVQIHKV